MCPQPPKPIGDAYIVVGVAETAEGLNRDKGLASTEAGEREP